MKALILLLLLAPIAAQADDGRITRQADALAEARAEVEELSAKLEEARAEHRARMRALGTERAEVAAQLRREELRVAQIDTRIDEARTTLAARGTDEELAAAVRAAASQLQDRIRTGLPLRTAERVDAVASIVRAMDDGLLRPERAVGRLWEAVEDELRLGKETALQRQAIPLDGGEQLVEVAHVGLVALYFRTEDDRLGRAVRAGEAWTFEAAEDAAEQARIADLMDSLRKGVRQGWFDLPGVLEAAR